MAAAEAIETLDQDASVHSFQPGPVFELTRANVSLNRLGRRISVHNLAASDIDGYLPMQVLIGNRKCIYRWYLEHYDLPLENTCFCGAVAS